MAYESFSEDFDKAKLDVTHELEGGIIFVQNEGECLCIPPFCPMMSFATKTSVLGTYSTITYDNYISMLRKLPLLKAWFTTELAGERKQSEFNCAMLKALDLMLNGEIDPEAGEFDDTYKLSFTENGLLRTLLCTWDEVKDDVVALIGPMDAKVMKDIWSAFLIESKGRECKICGKTIRNKQKLMRKHFVDNHWPKQKVTERIDSMEVLEGDEGEGHEAPLESVEVMEDILCE
ncbi:uncharacterized protein K460DRAFT_362764 [Cucurbitaria berberidis CBS 394.84]|uniref:Uncharacterized protein n=1 Tax=Cucurbitaria berberidis CBS 394.84 TaxID=1168544 RepID=A0A9P4LF33_9PLEO|nr:uncharacterized protein K460DRAFT_362764 [Cucurbitaria berberidis CBS 394.84]KAF1851992.1 hypothetical protein K460DRAFT_362764 [Cucurbitaria berberidis CBS 394.84]